MLQNAFLNDDQFSILPANVGRGNLIRRDFTIVALVLLPDCVSILDISAFDVFAGFRIFSILLTIESLLNVSGFILMSIRIHYDERHVRMHYISLLNARFVILTRRYWDHLEEMISLISWLSEILKRFRFYNKKLSWLYRSFLRHAKSKWNRMTHINPQDYIGVELWTCNCSDNFADSEWIVHRRLLPRNWIVKACILWYCVHECEGLTEGTKFRSSMQIITLQFTVFSYSLLFTVYNINFHVLRSQFINVTMLIQFIVC